MTRMKWFLLIQTVVCIALAVLLCASALGIYREGAARRAEDPTQSVYTPEIVADRLAPVAPLFFAFAGLCVAGLILGAKDEDAEKPARDAEILRDLVARRVVRPSEAMERERAAQRRLLWIGRGGFALCMVPVAVYLLDPAHFPQEDLEGMFYGLLRVFLPACAAGIGILAATSVLREKSVLRETEAARARLKEERAEGVGREAVPAARQRPRGALQAAVIAAAVALIVAGILNGSARDVLYKAIMICTECVGLG